MSTPFRHPQQTPARGTDFNLKPPKAPDRPLVPYMRFSRKMWSKVRADNPESQLWDIGKIVGALWRDTPDSEKSVYQQEYEIEKVEYDKAMKNYHNSHAYQQYISQKNRAKANEKSSRARVEGGSVVIQPVDEDEYNNELTSRRLAAIRFDRNHRLVAELFSVNMVPDARTIVTQSRMEQLKKQALSLSAHKQKLEDDNNKLMEQHAGRKRQIEKASEEFAVNLKKVCDEKPQLDEERFEKFVDEWKDKLADAYVEYKKKQDEITAKIAAEREKIVEETPVLAELVMGNDEEKATEDDPAKESEQKEEEEMDDEEEKESEETDPPPPPAMATVAPVEETEESQ